MPVILKARDWGRRYRTLVEGVRSEIGAFMPRVVAGAVEEDLFAGRFAVLVDGLDEAPGGQADLLRAELLRSAGRAGTRVVATCRRHDYGGELRDRFGECSIDPLTDEQVEAYASRELAGVPGAPQHGHFLFYVGERLAELVATPLFLVMTVEVMRTRTGGRVPENLGELYGAYAETLLTEWERLRMTGRPFEVDVDVKLAVLAAYARATWVGPPDAGAFSRAVLENRGLWDGERVRDELLRSGLLHQEAGGPEFFHPSFREYFFALDLSGRPDGELRRFADENHSDGALSEVFAFLVGLLADEERQALVLDRLEAGNLYAFGRCLRTRTKFGRPTGGEWPDRLVERYLGQVRSTYAALVDAHLAGLKDLLPPWRARSGGGPRESGVAIGGHVDAGSQYLHYELRPADEAADPAGLVSVGLSGGRPWGFNFRNLSYDGKGLDSAREVAFEDLTGSVERMLRDKKLPLRDNHALGVEYVENQLSELRSRASHGWVPDEFRRLSLRRSLEEVLRIVDRNLLASRGGAVTFAWQRDPSIGGFIETPVDFPRLREYLGRLQESGLDPKTFLPPERDVFGDELQRLGSGDSVLVDKPYSDEAIAAYVGRHYDLLQSAYRWIAENLFPGLKKHMAFYRVGPVRHRVLIYRNADEGSGADRRGRPSIAIAEWEPVAYGADSATVCEVTHEWPGDDYPGDASERYARIERALRDLGRTSKGVGSTWSTRSTLLTSYIGRMEVHDAVYRLLQDEIVKGIMRGEGGRLP